MPKANKQESDSTPFQFARQFTAPPFFVGLEDAKMKSRLLLTAMAGSRKGTVKAATKKASTPKPKTKTKTTAKSAKK